MTNFKPNPQSGVKEKPRSRPRICLSLFVRLTFLTICVFVLWFTLDIKTAFESLVSLSVFVVLGSFALGFLRIYLASIRWRILGPKESALSGFEYFRLTLIGEATGTFLPGFLTGDIVRIAMVHREMETGRAGTMISVAVDRFVGFLSILLLGVLVFILSPQFESRWLFVAVLASIALAMLVFAYLSSLPRLHSFLLNLTESRGGIGQRISLIMKKTFDYLHFYRERKMDLMGSLLLSIPIHVMWFVLAFMVARELGIEVSFWVVSATTVVIWVVMIVPISFGGLGVREIGFVYLLAEQGVDKAQAGSLALFQSAIILAIGLIILFTLFLFLGKK